MLSLLQSAFEKRSALFDVTDAYRIVNGVADGFPGVTLDKFGDRFQVQFFGPEMLSRRREIVEAIVGLFNPVCVVVKERLSRSGKSLENAPMEVAFGSREDAVASCARARAVSCGFARYGESGVVP
jgi:Predicted SAM-dependent methyltransferases